MVCLTNVDHSAKFALGTQTRLPVKSKVKVTNSHRLYVSSLPLLNSGNKMLHLCQ